MVMTDHERGLRSSDEMMAGYHQGSERAETDYELRLASLAMEIARMNVVDQEFLRSLLPSGPAQSSPGTPLCSVSSNNRPGATTLHQIPPLVQYATFVPPRFTIFSGEGHKQETSYAQWRGEVHSVWHSGLYQEAMVVTSIRRSLRGRAADVLLAMGSDVSVEQVLAKFDVRFGDVQPSVQPSDCSIFQSFSQDKLSPAHLIYWGVNNPWINEIGIYMPQIMCLHNPVEIKRKRNTFKEYKPTLCIFITY